MLVMLVVVLSFHNCNRSRIDLKILYKISKLTELLKVLPGGRGDIVTEGAIPTLPWWHRIRLDYDSPDFTFFTQASASFASS